MEALVGASGAAWAERVGADSALIKRAIDAGACSVCAVVAGGCRDTATLRSVSDEVAPDAPLCGVCCGCATALSTVYNRTVGVISNWRYVEARDVTPCISFPRSLGVRAALFAYKLHGGSDGCTNVRTYLERHMDLRGVTVETVSAACRAQGVVVSNASSDVLMNVVWDFPQADMGLDDRWVQVDPHRPKRKSNTHHNYKNRASYTAPAYKGGSEVQTQPCTWPSQAHVLETFRNLEVDALKKLGDPLPPPSAGEGVLSVSSDRGALLLAGRYLKYDRELPQTPWLINGKRMGRSSLQEELVQPLLPLLFPLGHPSDGAESDAPPTKRQRANESDGVIRQLGGTKFHSAGREDMDVRMFGSGRPFLLEVPRPQKAVFAEGELRQLESAINNSDGAAEVVPGSMKLVRREHFLQLSEASESKQKQYRCVVWVARALTDDMLARLNLTEVDIDQKTPLRVLHRRSLLTRVKRVHSNTVHSVINKHWLVLDIVTQAGTYIKEFVHGDRGRTHPSVASILDSPVDILQLDVTDVFCDL